MSAADGKTYAIYRVLYNVTRERYKGGDINVSLITDYTTFEDIRKIIAIKRGVKPEEIIVSSATLQSTGDGSVRTS